jgi:hypothetical protein
VNIPESVGLEPIEPLPADLLYHDKADVTEYPQMLRNRRDRYRKVASQLSDVPVTFAKKVHQSTPGRVGNCREHVGLCYRPSHVDSLSCYLSLSRPGLDFLDAKDMQCAVFACVSASFGFDVEFHRLAVYAAKKVTQSMRLQFSIRVYTLAVLLTAEGIS